MYCTCDYPLDTLMLVRDIPRLHPLCARARGTPGRRFDGDNQIPELRTGVALIRLPIAYPRAARMAP